MAEAAAAYLMLDIDKYSLTVGGLQSEEIPEGYLINEIFVSEGEGKMRRHANRYGVWKLVVHQH